MTTLRFIFQYIKRHRLQYILGIITLFIVDIANVFIPKMTGNITDGLKAGNIDWAGITHYLLILFLLGLTLAVGRFLWRYFLFGASRSIEKELRNDMFAHLETMDVEFYNQNKTGDLMTRFTSDLNSIRMAIGMAVICVFDAVVMSAMVIVQMMHYVDVRLTLMAVIPMLFILFGELYYGKVIMARFKARQEAVSDLTDFVQESFSGIRVIKAFVREKAQRYAFARENQKNLEKNLDIARMQSVVMPLLDVIIGLSSLITLLFGGYLAVNGQISLGRFVAFNQYINMLVWPMLACGEAVNMFSMGGASLKRVKAVFDAEPEVKDPQNGDEGIRAAEEVPVQEHEIVGHIRLEHLTFTHQDSNEPVLNDITLDVPAGTTLAIVSKTGGGKSTLVNLLLHLYRKLFEQCSHKQIVHSIAQPLNLFKERMCQLTPMCQFLHGRPFRKPPQILFLYISFYPLLFLPLHHHFLLQCLHKPLFVAFLLSFLQSGFPFFAFDLSALDQLVDLCLRFFVFLLCPHALFLP